MAKKPVKKAAARKPSGIVINIDARVASREHIRDLRRFGDQLQQALARPAVGDIPELGAIWPGMGGHNGGFYPGRDGHPGYYLIVPNGKEARLGRLAFGGYEKKISGADSRDDGAANTKALLASGYAHPAAKACADFRFEGFSDFFLPSRNQARYLSITVPELFEEGWHWTSTRVSSDIAFVQGFSDGAQFYGTLDYEYLVRPVRRHFINSSL